MFVADSMDFRSHKVECIKQPSPEWVRGNEYDILIQVMSDGRFCIFKSSAHYMEQPGYKIYNTRDAINEHFNFK